MLRIFVSLKYEVMERMFYRRIEQTNPTNPTGNINQVTNKVDYFENAIWKQQVKR